MQVYGSLCMFAYICIQSIGNIYTMTPFIDICLNMFVTTWNIKFIFALVYICLYMLETEVDCIWWYIYTCLCTCIYVHILIYTCSYVPLFVNFYSCYVNYLISLLFIVVWITHAYMHTSTLSSVYHGLYLCTSFKDILAFCVLFTSVCRLPFFFLFTVVYTYTCIYTTVTGEAR